MKNKLRRFFVSLLILCSFFSHDLFLSPAYSKTVAFRGGIVIDVSKFGNSSLDIPDSVILIEGSKIKAVGHKNDITIPKDAQIINIEGKYVLPGLIDGFAALDNQAYANAYLFMGVTSIVGIYGGRRASLFEEASPCPDLYSFGFVGSYKTSTQDMLNEVEKWAKDGIKFLLLHYRVKPDQAKAVIRKAHSLGIVTVGELGHTSYKDAVKYGINAFVHTIRYSIELAPQDMQDKVAAQPFGPPAREFRRWLATIDPEWKRIREYANLLGSSSVGLMPTLILGCINLPFLDNPWEEPIARILNPSDIHYPLNKSTGKHNFAPVVMEEFLKQARMMLKIEEQYCSMGAKYLAGSGTDIFGTMPGISLHQELLLLTKIGLSERQAIAAATGNFAELFKWTEIGQLKAGCRANILMVNENPLESIKNLKKIHMVILGGRAIDRDSLLHLNKKK